MQSSLFRELNEHQVHDLGNARIREYPEAFTRERADVLLRELIDAIAWQQDSLRIGGRRVAVPRLQCWMGDRESHYGYSGIRLQPAPWSEPVLAIRERVQEITGRAFNSVLLNYYRTGQDSVAWHADDEAELGTDPIIASVSLGAERPFQFKPKIPGNADRFRITLRHGSLLLMEAGLQRHWLHQLPKVNSLQAPRVNLTFRQIHRQAPAP